MRTKPLVVAMLASMTTPAVADRYTVSGSVNRMVRYADNGAGSDVQQVDNEASHTQFRFKGDEDIGNGLSVGVHVETSVSSNNASLLDMKTGDGGDIAFDIRHSALWFAGDWGRVTLGHTSDAQDGTSFADLSNTWLVNEWSSNFDLGGVITFGGTTTNLGSAYNSFDGGRRDLVRYDTPDLGPAKLRASISNDSRWSLAAVVYTPLGGGELSAAAGYTDFGGDNGPAGPQDQWSSSLSYKFAQGTNVTLGYGGADGGVGAVDPDMVYAKLGHAWGNNAVSIHYGESHDLSAPGEDNTTWAVGWVHTLRSDVELYAGYNHFELDRAGAQDVDIVVVGSRVRF